MLAASAAFCPSPARSGENGPQTGLVYSRLFLRHDTGPDHVERPDRLVAVISGLEKAGLMPKLAGIEPKPAGISQIAAVHSTDYIGEAERACRDALPYLHSPDTPVSADSYETALLAAGGVLAAVDAVMGGAMKNAFCAVRPPGHHARRERAMGFCIFNNAAIGAAHALKHWKARRVLIVDWDVHHGNGTQEAFYGVSNVLFASLHQHPFYPGTGLASEQGRGEGMGFTINVPLPAGTGDQEFLLAFNEKIKPKAIEFNPDLVIISAGFDAHKDDPLGGMALTADGFAELTRSVMQIADQTCSGRIVSVLEGGYNLDALADCAAAHVRELLGGHEGLTPEPRFR